MTGQLEGDLRAGGRLLEADLQIIAQVGPGHGPGAAAARAAAKAEQIAENIAEVGEDVVRTAKTARAALEAGMAEAVIAGAPVGIAQHVVGFRGFLELAFGFGIPGVAVRVILHGELAVGLFYLVFRSVAGHAQHFVIIALRHD